MRTARILSVVVLLAACGVASGAVRTSGIAGRVVAGPTCPVERLPPDPACAPRPLAAALRIMLRGGHWSTTVRSGSDGKFRVRLAPATYVVRPLQSPTSALPRPGPPVIVRVTPHRFTSVTITYDTGIR
jgi:hypothetical protein